MSRPDEIVDWAEDSGAQTSEPTNERAGGFPFRYTPPAEQINWMWRAVGRWINWLQNKADNHVHDGGATDLSVPKIDLTNHVDCGTFGRLAVEADTISEHVIRHMPKNSGLLATFRTDRLHANSAHLEKITMPLLGGTSTLRIAKGNPADPPVVVVVEGEIRTDVISSDNLVVTKLFGGSGHGKITANNTIKAWGMVDGSTADSGALITGEGIAYVDRNRDGSSPWIGTWDITLSSPVPDTSKVAFFVSGRSIQHRITWKSTTEVTVEILENAGGLSDKDFSIQLLYIGA